MTTTEPAAPTLADAECLHAKREFLNELGRIYLEAGLPLGAAFEAALADLRIFDLCRGRQS